MKICYLDFDKTIQELTYPETDIFYLNHKCVEFVKLIKEMGYKVVLNTYRADLNNGSLEQAIQSVSAYIQFDAIAPRKIAPQSFDLNKNVLFIDDESKGIPLIQSTKILGVMVVDFSKVITLLDLKNSEIQIGSQIWTNKNWGSKTFNNGENIPIIKSRGDWYRAVKEARPAICLSLDYSNEVLYNWFAINDDKGLIPEGYSIPTSLDLKMLIDNLGGEAYAGLKLKAADESNWPECAYLEPEERERKYQFGNCTEFNALPVGFRRPDGWFQGRFGSSNFWVQNINYPEKPDLFRLIEGVEAAILESSKEFEIQSDQTPLTQFAFSIRLIKKT